MGEIAGKDSTDACFTYADAYLENQEHYAISIGLPLEEKTFDATRTRIFFEGLLPDIQIGSTDHRAHFFGADQYAYEELVAEMCSCFMGSELKMEATPEHIENHKVYVQSWTGAIREKPETLIKAIKDAQAAANYMDYKAGLITEKEYEKVCGAVMEAKQKSRGMERKQKNTHQNATQTGRKNLRCILRIYMIR